MAFSYQKDVALKNKDAIQGDRANNQEVIYTPHNFTTASAVKVGGFVWRDSTNPGTQVAASTIGTDKTATDFKAFTSGASGDMVIITNR